MLLVRFGWARGPGVLELWAVWVGVGVGLVAVGLVSGGGGGDVCVVETMSGKRITSCCITIKMLRAKT